MCWLFLKILQIYIFIYRHKFMRWQLQQQLPIKQGLCDFFSGSSIKRIQSTYQLESTDQLITLVQKSLATESTSFILRILTGNYKFRITKGWPIRHYSIKSGLQLQVQLILMAKKQSSQNIKNADDEKTGQILFQKQEMPKIIQQEEDQGQKTAQISKIVSKKYQQLLKYIQKNNTQAYMREIKNNQPSLGPCENQYYKKQIIAIQNQLGSKGWAAIHCAVFAGNIDIVRYLIEIQVDINLKTSDQWTPIQLAVRQENQLMIDELVAQPNLNINVCTAHGLVLNMAVNGLNQTIVRKLLLKQVDFSARDHLGRTVYDMLGENPDKNMLQLLSSEERRQSFNENTNRKNAMYHALVKSYRGEVIYIKTPPRKDKQYYISINPYESQVKIYQDKAFYPQFPKQILQMAIIHRFKKMSKSQRSWYMKSDLFYFFIQTPKKKYIYGCQFQQTVDRWVQAYHQCLENINMYPQSIRQFQRNEAVIFDRIQKEPDKKKNNKIDSLINLFTSKVSEKSDQSSSPDKNRNFILAENNKKDDSTTSESPNLSKNTKKQKQLTKNQPKVKQQQVKNNNTNKQMKQPQANGKPQNLKNDVLTTNKATSTKNTNQTSSITSTNSNSNSENDQNGNKNGLKYTDFKITKTLGQGTFGTVYLATDLRNPQKKKQYALKCFKKKKLVVNKQIKYTVAQLNILKQLSHPFIVNLHFTFQTPNYVYLGLDYCPNRDLSHHLMNEVTFPQKQAMIYAAQILSALEYLHEKNIIYRDLKPENIMLDNKGHVRLVDFGLSKQGQDRDFVAKSFCGSPAYLSPEMLIKKGVGKQSDFYCLGAVLYQMIVGQPPFFSDDIVTLYNNISTSKLTFPKNISNDAKSLLTGLLEKKPERRLGYKGAEQIKIHPFFKDINWQNLLKKAINAPVRQQVQAQQQDETALDSALHKDFDYSPDNYRVNRFLNFSFIREDSSNQ